jgi:hypothetical protein
VKIGIAIEEAADAERELAGELRAVAERHRTDHDVFHLSLALARAAEERLAALGEHAGRYEASVDTEPDDSKKPKVVRAAIAKSAELVGRRPEPALLLLRDLRTLHLLAAEVSIDWVILGQGAQAARDAGLLATVDGCHPEVLRAMKWTTFRIKEASPQILTT